jgi:hypothetical protein
MRVFFAWLNQREGWAGVGPKELLIRQVQAEDPYEIPDLLQEYLNSHTRLRRATLYHRIWAVLEFLRKNHCRLPPDVKYSAFTVHSDLRPVQGRLSAEVISDVIAGMPPRWRSLFLVKYQAMLDSKRLCWVNVNSADPITSQLREGRDIIRVDLPCGRKKRAGDTLGVYFTYFGRDAASELTRYFNEVRGWPKWGEPIWVYSREDAEQNKWQCCKDRRIGQALDVKTVTNKWIRTLRSKNYVPKKPDFPGPNVRYGYNLHEFRDVATTELHTHAQAIGLDMDYVRFWCGQIGQLRHSPILTNKLFKNREYMEKQYAVAEPYLNIISGTPANRRTPDSTQVNAWSYSTTYTISFDSAIQPKANRYKVKAGCPAAKSGRVSRR